MTVLNWFDQASRYQAKLDPEGLVVWLLGPAVRFHGWLDTRTLPFPGDPDRTCDTVARLSEAASPEVPWAVPLEFQLRPDDQMFGRYLQYLGRLWMELRPHGRGQHYQVAAGLVNLTGVGNASQDFSLGGRARTLLQVAEINLATLDAAATLQGIAAGTITRALLPWIVLMRGGGESSNIEQWKQIAQTEPDPRRRSDYGGVALIYAEQTAWQNNWDKALEGWNVVESTHVLQWINQGKSEGLKEGLKQGITEGRLETLRETLRVQLEERFGPLPQNMADRIAATNDVELLRAAVRQVVHIQQRDELQL